MVILYYLTFLPLWGRIYDTDNRWTVFETALAGNTACRNANSSRRLSFIFGFSGVDTVYYTLSAPFLQLQRKIFSHQWRRVAANSSCKAAFSRSKRSLSACAASNITVCLAASMALSRAVRSLSCSAATCCSRYQPPYDK